MNDVLRNETRDREEAAPPAQTAAVARVESWPTSRLSPPNTQALTSLLPLVPRSSSSSVAHLNRFDAWGSSLIGNISSSCSPLPDGEALKIDPATRTVVLRLRGWGGFRRHVVRILTCLIYDRLKAQRDQFEPRIEVLRHPEAPLEVSSDLDPPVYPDPDRFSRASSQPGAPSAPSASDANRVPAASPKAPAPSETTLPLEPTVPVVPETPPRSGEPKRPQATTEGKARPLSGRVQR